MSEPVTIADEQKTIAVIDVREFEEYPVICTRDVRSPQHGAEPLLRDGAVYVRNQVPASVEISDHSLMRELLELAIDKGVRRFVRTAGGAGLILSAEQMQQVVQNAVAAMGGVPAPSPAPPAVIDDAAQFSQQRHDFEGGDE